MALLLVACSETDDITPPVSPDSDLPIELYVEGWKPMMNTRALIDDMNVDFKIYGYKSTNATDVSPVFMNQLVRYSTNGWTYSPTKYWDRTADYYFGAYAPANLSDKFTVTHVTTNDNHNCLSFTLPQWQDADKGDDLITATSKGSATAYLTNGKGVELNFSHTFGYLEIQLKKGANLPNTYTLTNLTCHNVPSSVNPATYTLDYTAGTSTLSTITAKSEYMVCNTSTVIKETSTNFSHLVVPFTSEAITLSLTYTTTSLDGNTFTYTREVDPQLTEIEVGRKYTLTLTFVGGADIKPEISIAQWNDVPIDNPIYNW